ncbi:MAG: hypothetical protein Q9212_001163 [Teloschistes hypoglaucus]
MNRLRSAPSKATPQTLCQKCLKRDNYECTAEPQQRPYVSRPSRTQQLANPKLVPSLTSHVPSDLLRKSVQQSFARMELMLKPVRKGVADEQLAKVEQQRKDEAHRGSSQPRRSASISSRSSDSVSTISTNMSRSPSPTRMTKQRTTGPQTKTRNTRHAEITSSRASSVSYSSTSSGEKGRPRGPSGRPLNQTLEETSLSHQEHGTSRSGDRVRANIDSEPTRKRRRSHASESSSSDKRRSVPREDNARHTRPRRSKVSPDSRGRDRWSGTRRTDRRARSRGNSVDRSRVARERRSMTPGRASGWESNAAVKPKHDTARGQGRYSTKDDHHRGSYRDKKEEDVRVSKPRQVPNPRRERSLSPFSKRLAITQAMNMGR